MNITLRIIFCLLSIYPCMIVTMNDPEKNKQFQVFCNSVKTAQKIVNKTTLEEEITTQIKKRQLHKSQDIVKQEESASLGSVDILEDDWKLTREEQELIENPDSVDEYFK